MRREIAMRVRRLCDAPDAEFGLAPDGKILWQGEEVAQLAPATMFCTRKRRCLPPRASRAMRAKPSGAGSPTSCARNWAASWARSLPSKMRANGLVMPARSCSAFAEGLGVLPAIAIADAVAALPSGERKALARRGLHFGARHLYVPALLRPKAQALRAALWSAARGASVPALPSGTAASRDPAISEEFYAALGFVLLGERLLRVDRLETLAATLRRLARPGPFAATVELAKLAGARLEELPTMLPALGYRAVADGAGAVTFHPRPGHPAKRHRPAARRAHRAEVANDHPFAKLKDLNLRR